MQKRWDIFCKIVDNFGDIGVCWRLARQLQTEHGLQIRLWIDDLKAAQKIIPSLNIALNTQIIDQIELQEWPRKPMPMRSVGHVADVVIEAFSCGLPPDYLAQLSPKTVWVNLEYLSAEPWVADFHAKPSPQANGLTRYFYFPGFTDATGGLIRESNICARHSDESRNPDALKSLDSDFRRNDNSGLKISLFCYPNAPIKDLFSVLQANSHEVFVYVPESAVLKQIADFFGEETIGVGDYFTRKNLHVHILPFLSQADYDQLLCDCDLNFVRGEDSWIRAIWAGKPFIWQPYFQDENAHIKKLDAFLDFFYRSIDESADNYSDAMTSSLPSFPRRRESSSVTKNKMDSRLRGNDGVKENIVLNCVTNIHHAWLAGHITIEVWQGYLHNLATLKSYSLHQSQQLAKQPDLAAKLVIFCNNI